MRAISPQPLARPGFGRPGSVNPAMFFTLPLPMQADGVRLMLETGETIYSVGLHLGLSPELVASLRDNRKCFNPATPEPKE